ncbi:MAG: cytochrome c biogenesis protein CcsA [Ignavibacteriales bacterium]|nr:Cytochrome c biogenesis protein CcsA [Ignavibacteriaceae bacterium]MCK6615691.1 cytochrome c biogenesis protein [Ignavibacteriaceae bacterium]QOJ30217.1 MAG: cytochrome c biogenesis protein CcsA [Ignavibacteriales bacterium]
MKSNILKVSLFLLLAFVTVAGLAFPIVEKPAHWYEFPLIPGLEENAKIIFFHVPTSWVSVIAFFMSTVFSIMYLRKKRIEDDYKAYTAAQLGMIFTILATVTGAIWAKFAWGAFWSWDPRQTSIFALMLIYGAYFALRSAIEDDEKRARLSSVYSIIAFITVPFFVFIMPRIMRGLHPGSADDSHSGPVVNFKMDQNMLLIFYLSLLGFTILYWWMWSVGHRSLALKEKVQKNYN